MGEFFLRALGVLLLCGFCVASWGASWASKRPMLIHQVKSIGLEIWTEARPEWDVRTDLTNGLPVFVAETPALSVPPAGMSWTSHPQITFASNELETGARGAIEQVARNYGLRDANRIELQQASYGDFIGYQSVFSGDAHGTPVDVQVFCGHQPGRPAVLMHAYTLKGKLGQIREHIRRSWTHVRYLT